MTIDELAISDEINALYARLPIEHRREALRRLHASVVPAEYAGHFVRPDGQGRVDRAEVAYELEGLMNAQSIGFMTDMIPLIFPHLKAIYTPGLHLEALDVGSRTGAGAALVADIFQTYHSTAATFVDLIDIDPQFRDYALSRWSNIRQFIVGDVFDLADQSYDFVVCSHTIEHLPDPIPFCEKLRAIARKYAFFYCPYEETQPIPGHFRVPETTVAALNPVFTKIIDSGWFDTPCVFFVLEGRSI